MYRLRIIWAILFFAFCYSSYGQVINYSEQADRVTANLFQYRQWKALIKEGKKALKNDIDFYALRYRMGVAYFERENYMKAIVHFNKTLAYYPADTIVMDYIYWSYILANRKQEADKFLQDHKQSLSYGLKSKLKNKFIRNALVLMGPVLSNNKSKNGNINPARQGAYYGEITLINNSYYVGASLTHSLFKKMTITHGYQFLDIERTQTIKGSNLNINRQNDIYQNQYYISADFLLFKSLYIKPALNFIFVNFNNYEPVKNFDINSPKFELNYISLTDQLYYLGVYKYFRTFTIGLSCAYADLNYSTQLFPNLSLSWFPFGNLKLYSISNLTGISENNKFTFVVDEKIGYRLFKKLWIEAFATVGKFQNYVQDAAFNVYNLPNTVRFKGGANLMWPVGKHLQVDLIISLRKNKIITIR
jgi:hypothetical protein